MFCIEIGSGSNKKDPTATSVDTDPDSSADVISDGLMYLQSLPSLSVDQVSSYHLFEHLDNHALYLNEFDRVLKKSGRVVIVVPHFSNPYFYSDPTHSKAFGLYTLSYYVKSNLFKRTLPKYALTDTDLYLSRVRLRFKSPKFLALMHPFFMLLSLFFNSHSYLQEIYEYLFSSIIPCYEIEYILLKGQ